MVTAATPGSAGSRRRRSRTASRPARGWILGANTALPASISIAWACAVPAHFHARYSAEARTYRYLILNRTGRSALAAARATNAKVTEVVEFSSRALLSLGLLLER